MKSTRARDTNAAPAQDWLPASDGDRSRTSNARVWVVSELYHPERTSTGYFLTNIAEALAQQFDVNALCSQPTYSARGLVAPRREVRNGVFIRRVRSTRFPKDVLVGRVVNLLTFSLTVFSSAARRLRRGDLVLVVTNPPLLPYMMLLAARLRGARLVLLVHDVYPEVLVATGKARAESALVRLWNRASRRLYRSADRVIVLGRDMRALVAHKIDDHTKIRVIPNWGEVEQVRPSKRAGEFIRARLQLERKFIVQFMGNMGISHAMDALVNAAEALRQDSDVHFLLMGWGARRAWVEQQVTQRTLQNVTVLAPCTEQELCAYLNACDLAIIPFVPGMGGISVPSRIYNVLSAGKPLLALADMDSELARIVREDRVGWIVPAAQPERLSDGIIEAKSQPAVLLEMAARARRAAESKYTLDFVRRSYLALFDELISGQGGGVEKASR